MILILYNCALLLGMAVGWPWLLFRIAVSERHREGFWERLRGAPGRLRSTLAGERTIWVHAVSVGEVMAASGLVRALEARARGCRVVISTTTRTGQRLARERFGAERCFFFPLDMPWGVRRTLRVLRPSLLILVESELWPNVLDGCLRRGIPVLVVNGRISDRSLPRYLRLRRLWTPFLRALTRVLAQSAQDARRFVEIGVPAARVETGGNLKFDVRSPESGIAVLEALRAHLPEGAGVVVCGSTLEGEEAALLNAWPGVVKQAPRSVMLLAPRHPERFGEVAELLRTRGAVYAQRSKWMRAPGPIAPGSVFLLDSIGELAAVYQLGAVAFVGGSLVPAGGHNPLEPAQFGVPVVMGPSYENFRAIVELLRAAGGVEIISTEELGPALVRLLEDRSAAEEAGARARAVFEREAGATERGVRAALGLLEGGRA